MDAFDRKKLKTSRGFTYTYYTVDGDKSLPTLVFQHGWPDNAAMWRDVAGPLRSSTQHPMIIADLLGYDGTDKPTDVIDYTFDKITRDLMDICDHEEAEKIVSIGHDWGATCAARLYNYFPGRVVGLVLLNVAYRPPTRRPFDLDAINNMTEQMFGYKIYNYWYLFTAPDGPAVLRENVERLFEIMHAEGADSMKLFFTVDGAMREELTTKKTPITVRSYAQGPAFRKAFVERFSRDGFDGPQMWYKCSKDSHQYAVEKNLPAEVDKVQVPTYYLGVTQDAVCRPDAMIPAIKAGLLPYLEQAELIDAAHWVLYEKPDEVVKRLEPWLQKTYKASSTGVIARCKV